MLLLDVMQCGGRWYWWCKKWITTPKGGLRRWTQVTTMVSVRFATVALWQQSKRQTALHPFLSKEKVTCWWKINPVWSVFWRNIKYQDNIQFCAGLPEDNSNICGFGHPCVQGIPLQTLNVSAWWLNFNNPLPHSPTRFQGAARGRRVSGGSPSPWSRC